MKTDNIDLGKVDLNKLKENSKLEYGLKRLDLTDQLVLTKNGQPLMIVPEHLRDDFVHLIAVSNVTERDKQVGDPDDLKDIPLFTHIINEIR